MFLKEFLELEQATPSHAVHAMSRPPIKCGGSRTLTCYQCGGRHLAGKCPFKEKECYNCGKKGHIGKVCCSKCKNTHITPQPKFKGTKETYHFDSDTEELSDQLGRILSVATHARPMMVTVLVNSVTADGSG